MHYDPKTRRPHLLAVSKDATGKETVEAQVLVADDSGQITEVRTGPAGGVDDGPRLRRRLRARDHPPGDLDPALRCSSWSRCCRSTRPRRLLSLRTLDLLVLLSFSVSLIWFNRGEIFTSVPLQYPPMVYLGAAPGVDRDRPGARGPPGPAAAPAARRRPPAPAPGARRRRRPVFGGSAPTWVLVTLLIVTLALRFGLNAFDSNVIDVGYAGVIGADRIAHGTTPYGTMPSDCGTCDTYGPLELHHLRALRARPAVGRARGTTLPAAHGAATLFDVLCIAGMFALGWRISGLRLGMGLALAWAAFPFTAFALETNTNDSLVAGDADLGPGAVPPPARARGDARPRAGDQVRARRAAAAVEPQAVPAAAAPGAQPAGLRRRAGASRSS